MTTGIGQVSNVSLTKRIDRDGESPERIDPFGSLDYVAAMGPNYETAKLLGKQSKALS